jgi:hypothetical protein
MREEAAAATARLLGSRYDRPSQSEQQQQLRAEVEAAAERAAAAERNQLLRYKNQSQQQQQPPHPDFVSPSQIFRHLVDPQNPAPGFRRSPSILNRLPPYQNPQYPLLHRGGDISSGGRPLVSQGVCASAIYTIALVFEAMN